MSSCCFAAPPRKFCGCSHLRLGEFEFVSLLRTPLLPRRRVRPDRHGRRASVLAVLEILRCCAVQRSWKTKQLSCTRLLFVRLEARVRFESRCMILIPIQRKAPWPGHTHPSDWCRPLPGQDCRTPGVHPCSLHSQSSFHTQMTRFSGSGYHTQQPCSLTDCCPYTVADWFW